MAYDPLTASYLATVPEAPPIQAPTPQGMMALQQMAGQLAIQKQVQAENALKLQAAAEDRQDEETFAKAFKENSLKAMTTAKPKGLSSPRQTAPVVAPEDQEAGTAGDVTEAPQTELAPSMPDLSSPNLDSVWHQTLQQVGPSLKLRNQVKFANEEVARQKAAMEMTNDERARAKDAAENIGSILLGVIQATDPTLKQGMWETAKRQALANGEQAATAWPDKVPDDDTLSGLASAHHHVLDTVNIAEKKAQTQKALQDAATKKAKEDADKLAQDKAELSLQLGNAGTGEEYMALKAAADPNLAKFFPDAPVGEIDPKFARKVLQAGMTEQDRIKDQVAQFNQDMADRKAAQAANKLTLDAEQTAALIATGAADPKNPTQAEMDKAEKYITTQKVAARPVTNNYAAMTPDQRKGIAQMIVSGKANPDSVRRMLNRNPELFADVYALDPSFDEALIDKRYSTLKEFTNTSTQKAGGQLLALNTLVHHADLYLQVADALKNGNFKPGNAIYNAVATAFGSAPPTRADLVARFLASETGKVATGGVPAEGEINGILKGLGSDAGPDQIKGAADALLNIASGRMIPLKEKRDDANLQNVVQILGPDSRTILSARGYDPDTLKKSGSNTAAQPIPDAVQKLLSPSSVQPGIHKLSDGTTWMKAKDGTITKQ